jgi:hypothetical protein
MSPELMEIAGPGLGPGAIDLPQRDRLKMGFVALDRAVP